MKKIIYLISFFIFSGYYIGLSLIFFFGISNLSRFYSIPIRIGTSILCIYLIKINFSRLINNKNKIYISLFIGFWFFYIIKVMLTEIFLINNHLSLSWPEYIFYVMSFVFFPFLAFCSIPIEKYKDTILNALILSGFILGLCCLYLYGSLLLRGIGRLSMITYETGEAVLNPLILSYSGVLTLSLCVYKLVFSEKRNKKEFLYLVITIILSFIMFLLGSSRGSIIALIFTLPLFLIYTDLKKKIVFFICFFLSIPIFYWSIERSGSNILDRLNGTSEDGGGGRVSLWTDAFNHFTENPIFGGRIELGGIYPHNFILEILMSTGIIGALFIFPLFIKSMFLGIRESSKNKENIFVFIILIQAFTQYFFTGGLYTSNLIFIPIAILLNITSTNNKPLTK